MNAHDVLVIGAGPAGASAAQRLAHCGLSVLLVEKSAFPRRKVCGEHMSAGTWPLLDRLSVAGSVAKDAGPPVRRVGLFARDTMLEAPMPPMAGAHPWGRALGRHRLDAALLEAAARAGATVRQPATVACVVRDGSHHRATLQAGGRREHIVARLVVDAHGSWERPLGPMAARGVPRDADLLGFKARFANARLASGLMPLVLFPGGYGGMVASDSDTVSLSCCVRRDTLRAIRAGHRCAGDALLAHVLRHCRGVREALDGAEQEQPWMAAGPIRPGLRPLYGGGIFSVGNAAGEAHPLVAEGIAMAIQSGFLLAQAIAAEGALGDRALAAAGRSYARAWRGHFVTRVRASAAFAALTMAPATAALSVALLRRIPAALTLGATLSGKARGVSIAGSGA
jgi:menaquinone-9 beta-reductase